MHPFFPSTAIMDLTNLRESLESSGNPLHALALLHELPPAAWHETGRPLPVRGRQGIAETVGLSAASA